MMIPSFKSNLKSWPTFKKVFDIFIFCNQKITSTKKSV